MIFRIKSPYYYKSYTCCPLLGEHLHQAVKLIVFNQKHTPKQQHARTFERGHVNKFEKPQRTTNAKRPRHRRPIRGNKYHQDVSKSQLGKEPIGQNVSTCFPLHAPLNQFSLTNVSTQKTQLSIKQQTHDFIFNGLSPCICGLRDRVGS